VRGRGSLLLEIEEPGEMISTLTCDRNVFVRRCGNVTANLFLKQEDKDKTLPETTEFYITSLTFIFIFLSGVFLFTVRKKFKHTHPLILCNVSVIFRQSPFRVLLYSDCDLSYHLN